MDQNDPKTLMLSHKEILRQEFYSEFTKVEKSLKIASNIVMHLKDASTEAINLQFFLRAVEYFRTSPDHKHIIDSKTSFHVKMLIDVAEINSFELATRYLRNPSTFMSSWVQEYIFNALQVNINDQGTVLQNIYYICVRSKFNEMLVATRNAFTKIEAKYCKVNELWQKINSHLELTMIAPVMTIPTIGNEQIQVEKVCEEISSELNEARYYLTMRSNADLKKDLRREIEKVVEYFEKDLVGCKELCPFCGGPCDNTAGCTSHLTRCHRPQGISGQNWHWWNWKRKRGNELVVDLCTTSVADKKQQFKKSDVDNKWHKYHEYRTVYESWMIPPIVDTNTQLYWKWFMAKYNKEFADFHGCLEAEIPDSWKQITWEEAKQDLINLYKPRT
ncbi:interferon-induced very large GTPase 1-like [Antedon mediterranea]|uniref:interferon-induced very large GTPase 1-like n=1 Tax=Antedon mediterranea TaxID=105859 RepID=UPI003AF912BB